MFSDQSPFAALRNEYISGELTRKVLTA